LEGLIFGILRYFEKAMADGNKPNHLCFKWGSNAGETANWHVPHNKVKSKNKIFL